MFIPLTLILEFVLDFGLPITEHLQNYWLATNCLALITSTAVVTTGSLLPNNLQIVVVEEKRMTLLVPDIQATNQPSN